MANRSIELTLKSNVTGLVTGLKTAQTAASNAGRDLDAFRKNNEQVWSAAGTAATAAGTVMVAGAGMAVKAAMDWESAWAGVTKTVDGSEQQLSALEDGLRTMATELPATHQEIAAVAEAAGALGVATPDIESFTRTMIDLGETTNLTADEAATSLAQFMNIMGTAGEDVDNLGSTLVELGNNGASTEKDILMMSQRIAAVGAQMGMTEADVMGLASAMSSVGIEAEAGGTAISMTMKTIDSDVRAGGDSLAQWAELAGVSASEFASAWENDAAGALTMVTTGLGEAGARGEDMNGILSELGITGIRETDTMLRLAQSGTLLADSFETASSAFDSASALAEEAGKRYETTEAKIAIAWNQIKDAAIDAGGALLPIVASIAEGAADLAGAFSALPDPVKSALGLLSGIGGVALLGVGGMMKLAPAVAGTVGAFRDLSKTAPGAVTGLKNFGKVAGGLTAGAAAATALITGLTALYNSAQDAAPEVEELANALLKLQETGDIGSLDELFNFGSVTTHIGGFTDALDHIDLSNPVRHIQSFGDTVFGLNNPLSQARDAFESLDQTLSVMDAESAADQMNTLRLEAEAAGNMDLSSWSSLTELFPEYTAAVEEAANATGQSTEAADLFQAAMGNLPPELQAVKDASDNAAKQEQLTGALEEVGLAADGTVESLSAYLDMLFETGLAEMSARDAQSAYQESIDAVGDAVEQIIADHGGLGAALNDAKSDFDLTTEAGRLANTEFQNLATNGLNAASAMAENGAAQEDVQAHLQGTYDSLILAAGQFGITGEEADTLARSVMGIPEGKDIETWMSDEARAKAEETKASVNSIPDQATIDAWMSDAAFLEALATRAAVLGIPEEDVISSFMSDAARDEAGKTTAEVLGIPEGASITSWMSDSARREAQSTNDWLNTIDGKHTTSTHEHTNITHNRIINQVFGTTGISSAGPGVLRPGGYTGGIVGRDFGLPGLATGGRLPYTGLGTDQILGIGSNGQPTALVDDGEWVIRERSADKYNRLLGMVNQDHPSVRHLAGYAGGGSVGREWSTQSMASAVNSGPVSASVDSGVIANAVASAIASYQPVVKIGMREFIGEMKQDRAWTGAS